MRHRIVIALALLSIALTGAKCEFRAASNNSIQRDPQQGESTEQKSGLLIVARAAESRELTAQSPSRASIVSVALAASVLSKPSFEPTPTIAASTLVPRPQAVPPVSVLGAPGASIANAVPEPGAVWLYAAGSIFLAWRLRPSR